MPSAVLIVDDESWLAENYIRMLQKSDIEAYRASGAAEALEFLEDYPHIDLILLDLMMPEHNGLTLLNEAVSQMDWQMKKFVIMTTLLFDDVFRDKNLWPKLQIIDFVYKPDLQLELLPDKVLKWIKQ